MRYITIALITCITMGSCNNYANDQSSVVSIENGPVKWKYKTQVQWNTGNYINLYTNKEVKLGDRLEDIYCDNSDIDLPEEWQAISTDSTRADTLLGWRSSDGVVHIEFNNERNR